MNNKGRIEGPVRLKVLALHQNSGNQGTDFICQMSDGYTINVDLVVDGTLPTREPEEIIGKTIEVSWLHPYMFIAHDIQFINEAA